MSPNSLLSLPPELTARILLHLNCWDVLHLAQTCKQFHSFISEDLVWDGMGEKRWGHSDWYAPIVVKDAKNQEMTNITWSVALTGRELYRYKSKLRTYSASANSSITWLNDSYWRLKDDRRSEFGKVAALDHVWWFHVETLFPSVPAGTYQTVWRLRSADKNVLRGATLNVFVEEIDLENPAHRELRMTHRCNRGFSKYTSSGYFEFSIPKLFTITDREEYAKVRVNLEHHDDRTMKQRIKLDWCELRRVGSNEAIEEVESTDDSDEWTDVWTEEESETDEDIVLITDQTEHINPDN
ncbi:hypothetical protein K7432_007778 [Basidiobolus ranarum]|uniref:F-box domain-containing protein n=1 Tax=Basidiobolus ranarum TaxID=34480 RepID=A0ABR2VZN3_9FUNG